MDIFKFYIAIHSIYPNTAFAIIMILSFSC
jgi:hypothetical protein